VRSRSSSFATKRTRATAPVQVIPCPQVWAVAHSLAGVSFASSAPRSPNCPRRTDLDVSQTLPEIPSLAFALPAISFAHPPGPSS
jgi:hypothetical protein